MLCIFVLLYFFSNAQNNNNSDSADSFKDEPEDTTIAVLPDEVRPVEETNDDEETDSNKVQAEYFLRKEFTGGFADSINLRKLPDSVLQRLRADDAFWYANEVFTKKQQKESKSFTSHPVVQTILWLIIIAGFVTFLVMYLSSSHVKLFRKSKQIAAEEHSADSGDIFAINYEREIDKAIGLNNYRLAVRLMFLRLLKNLADQNIIQYKQDSTNFDYLLQMQPTAMYGDFFKLTRHYEYSWYGQFEIDPAKFAIIKNEFDRAEGKIK